MNCSQDGSSADIKKEVDAAVRLNGHDNIVSVLRHGTLRNFDLVEHYYIDMEYCALDLDCYIRRTWTESIVNEVPRSLTEDTAAKTKMWQILQITHDILDGLSFIHSNSLVHRDIKPRNSTFLLVVKLILQFSIHLAPTTGKLPTLASLPKGLQRQNT